MSRTRATILQPAGLGASGRLPAGPLAAHVAVGLLSVVLLLLPAATGAARAAAGLYFAVVLVPAVQVLLWIFGGWRASLAAGVAVALLTGWQAIAPPRPLVTQPTQWKVAFVAPDQALRSRLNPPPGARAAALLASGGSATIGVCRTQGPADDLQVSLGGAVLTEVKAEPGMWSCWLQLAVRPEQIPSRPSPVEVVVRPNRQKWENGDPSPVLTGGYTRPAAQGGRSGGAQFFNGITWTDADLSPSDPGVQAGRYFVELRIADAAGTVREVWY